MAKRINFQEDLRRKIRECRASGLTIFEAKAELEEAGYKLPLQRIKKMYQEVPDVEQGSLVNREEAREALGSLLAKLHVLIVMYIGQATRQKEAVKPLVELLDKFFDGLKLLHPIEQRTAIHSVQEVVERGQIKSRLLSEVKRLQSVTRALPEAKVQSTDDGSSEG